MFVGFSCANCKYLREKLKNGWKVCCDAYPDGIPSKVLLHTEREDLKDCGNGFRYDPMTNTMVRK